MNAKDQLRTFKKALDAELKKYLDYKTEEAAKISPYAKEMMEHISDLTLRGGKRIRAALFYYSYVAHGGKNLKEALVTSMAMEMSETFLLIHDDIIDNDILRRGGITINEAYSNIGDEKFHSKINPRKFGESIAILAGNIASELSNEIIACSSFKPEFRMRAILELNKVYVVENYGQMLDLLCQVRDDINKDDVILVHQLKTVPYTFDGPVKIGAILAGASERDIKRLEGYSVPLGTAFQIQDDILGIFGSEEKLGKPITSDLREGKKTLLILNALEKANKKQQETINSNLGNKRAGLNSLLAVRKVIEDTWSLAEAKRLATNLVQNSIDSISSMRLKKEGKDFMVNIADYMIHREY
ncbi:MAG TPA: polyprenyl synthetase family protein [bacterium]|nr:polyprenyl synthetase family protein [bacterium]